MPIRKVKGGYKWGSKGKVYRNRKDAERQAAAAYASGYKKSMDWFDTLKRDKKDMRVGTVYPSDREGKKIMMLTDQDKKIHAGAKGMSNWAGRGKKAGGGKHKDPERRKKFRDRMNCEICEGKPIRTSRCLACQKLW